MSKRWPLVALCAAAILLVAWFFSTPRNLRHVEPVDSPSILETGADPDRDGQRLSAEDKSSARVARDAGAIAGTEGASARGATLRAIVVAKETGLPLAHARFEVTYSDDCGFWAPRFAALESDANGRAELGVDPGISMALEVRLAVEPFSSERISIEPLTAGERRDVRVELVTAPDIQFWARVVRDDDGTPVPFASAELVYRNPISDELVRHAASADANALIAVSTSTWKESVLLVEVEGFAQASARIVPGHETTAKAFELRLARASRLNVHVVNPAGAPLPGLTARASAAAYELSQSDFWFDDAEHVRSRFEAQTDAEGRVSFDDLPPRVEIELSVLEHGQLLMRDGVKQRLDPGQEREVTLVVGGKATVFGRAVDQFDRPVALQELWLVKPDPTMGMTFREWTTPSVRAKTDADGAFEIADVAEGEWWIGPAGTRKTLDDPAAAVAEYGQHVVIPPGAGRFQVTLRMWRGVYLRGFVRTASGEPAADCSVLAQATDVEHTGYLSSKSDARGAFALGPVCGVEYELRAGGAFQGEFAESPRVLADGGRDDIVLIVERAAILRGVVLDSETGEACDAMLHVTRANNTEGMVPSLGSQTNEKKFEITGITSGVWDVSATARNARMGSLRVTLAAGETKEIVLRAAPSVALTFKNTSPTEFFYVHPFSDGLALELAGVDPGAQHRFALVPGRITLRIGDANAKTLATREIELAPGASGEISYP